MRIFKNAWFTRFARKEKIALQALLAAVARAKMGLIDADLGGGVIKQRIVRPGQGKSGGYRSVVFYRMGERAFFMFGFAKNAQDNISHEEEAQFKNAAKVILALSDDQIRLLIENGKLEEVTPNGQDIPQ
jgi:hypothetical protein